MIERPSKIVCVGMNYTEHVREFGGILPTEPVLFMKAASSWSACDVPLIMPAGAEKLDYEVELGVVIGREAKNVSRDEAKNYISGFTVVCDYSERAWQKERGGQWMKGKSHDGFCPAGPRVVPAEEIGNVQNLRLWSRVNGKTRQDGTTADMIFPVDFLISYISQFMTLWPGDVVATGTPSGVGMGMEPPQFLKVGDVVELGIEGIGEFRQEIVSA